MTRPRPSGVRGVRHQDQGDGEVRAPVDRHAGAVRLHRCRAQHGVARRHLELDDHGFIPTGPALYSDGDGEKRRRPRRQPMMLETSQPGVFTAGGVRSGSVKRVASAVGEGSMAVRQIHEHFGV